MARKNKNRAKIDIVCQGAGDEILEIFPKFGHKSFSILFAASDRSLCAARSHRSRHDSRLGHLGFNSVDDWHGYHSSPTKH